MDCESKRDVGVWLATDIEAAGVTEAMWIAIGGADHGPDQLARGNHLAVNRDVSRGGSKHPLDGLAKTEHFLDGGNQQIGRGEQPGELIGAVEAAQNRVGYQVRGGLLASHAEKLDEVDDLVRGQAIPSTSAKTKLVSRSSFGNQRRYSTSFDI